jgi:hypothetical protein
MYNGVLDSTGDIHILSIIQVHWWISLMSIRPVQWRCKDIHPLLETGPAEISGYPSPA